MDKQDGRFIVTQVAVGWVLLLLIKVFSFSAAILFSISENNGFQTLAGDPGPDAARIFLYVFWIVSLIPIYVFLVSQRAKGVALAVFDLERVVFTIWTSSPLAPLVGWRAPRFQLKRDRLYEPLRCDLARFYIRPLD